MTERTYKGCHKDAINKAIKKATAGSESELNDFLSAVGRLDGLAERWEETTVWHEPPFLDGEIHITTGDLKDIATLVRHVQGR